MNEQSLGIGTMEEIVLTNSKNVRRLAWSIINLKLYDKGLYEDLVQQGFVGLIEAYERFDSNKICGHFWGYAKKSVKGRMVEFTAQYFNYFKPSKQVNAVIIQIHKRNLSNKSPQFIANLCGCSLRIAMEALHLFIIRRPIYLHEPVRNNEDKQDKEFINVIEFKNEQEEILFEDIINESTDLEKKVIQMLIDGYSRENILEHTGISAIELKEIIDAILLRCGQDPNYISNRNEVRLMKISSIETQTPHLQEVTSSCFEWVDVNKISSSPKNPRKDLTVNTQQMQEILTIKGWEEPITCYKRGPYYFILSGHRRWHAAKEAGEKLIPVYLVDTPKDQADELDRLGSLQSGQVAWTPYESAKNTYDRWLYSGGISYSDLGKKLGITKNRVAARIHVYKYYPKEEIADKLANGMYSISMLDYIAQWIKRLSQYQPELVNDLSMEFIRQQMLRKYENKCFNSHSLNDKTFVTNATKEELFQFLCDANKTLKQCQTELVFNHSRSGFVAIRVNIFKYFPHHEIEEKLINGVYSISILHYLIIWLENLNRLKPEIVEALTLDLIRTTMLTKIERKLVTILDLKSDLFIRNANDDQIKNFFVHPTKKLSEALADLAEGYEMYKGKSKINVSIDVINNAQDIVGNFQTPHTKEECIQLEEIINQYKAILLSKKNELESFLQPAK